MIYTNKKLNEIVKTIEANVQDQPVQGQKADKEHWEKVIAPIFTKAIFDGVAMLIADAFKKTLNVDILYMDERDCFYSLQGTNTSRDN